jgi:16S rRNA (guanine527-N7)-methyltransferase
MIDSEDSARRWLADLPGCDAVAMRRLEQLVALLGPENLRQNLVSAASLGAVWQRHIADSAQLLIDVPRETAGPWLDLGTGAGFPGLVIAALRPGLEMVLIESRARRADWLQHCARELGLPAVRVECQRLERIPTFHASVISARAFAPLDKLLEISVRFSTSATLWRLPKGRSAQQELSQIGGWNHAFHVKQSLTDPDAGIIVGQGLQQARRKR